MKICMSTRYNPNNPATNSSSLWQPANPSNAIALRQKSPADLLTAVATTRPKIATRPPIAEAKPPPTQAASTFSRPQGTIPSSHPTTMPIRRRTRTAFPPAPQSHNLRILGPRPAPIPIPTTIPTPISAATLSSILCLRPQFHGKTNRVAIRRPIVRIRRIMGSSSQTLRPPLDGGGRAGVRRRVSTASQGD